MKVVMMEPHTNHDQPCRCERNDPFKGAQGADPMPTDKEQKEEEEQQQQQQHIENQQHKFTLADIDGNSQVFPRLNVL